MISTSLGPAIMSMRPTEDHLLRRHNKGRSPGPTILSTLGWVRVPKASAANRLGPARI